MQGRYTHIVADWSGQSASAGDYTKNLCHLGIMGTEYVRTTSVLDSIVVNAGDTQSFPVEHIVSSLSITTDLEINLRQQPGKELSFISFVESSDSTQVTIEASLLICDATYELTLESFNSLSTVQAALKTDEITIQIDSQPYLANIQSLIDD